MEDLDQKINNRKLYVLLLGETGAGKSSLVNLFKFWSVEQPGKEPNYSCAKDGFLDKSVERGGSQIHGQTQKPVMYELSLPDPDKGEIYHLHLIDTPGMGDVAGLQRDDENIPKILESISSLPCLHAIVLMLNGSNARVSFRTKYVLQRLYGLCPDLFKDMFFLMFSNTQLMPNFDVKQITLPIKDDNIITMDNLLFSPAGAKYDSLSKMQKVKIQSNYKECKEILSIIFKSWLSTNSYPTTEFAVLRESRQTFKLMISCILEVIKGIQESTAALQIEEESLHNTGLTLAHLRKKASLTTEVVTFEQVPTKYHNTQCMKCRNLCHENCKLKLTLRVGVDIFKNCACMDRKTSSCKHPICKHSFENHGHVKFKIIEHKKTVPLLTEDDKILLSKSESTMEATKLLSNKIKEQLKIYQTLLDNYEQDLKINLVRLKRLCPYFDYKLELTFAIEMLKEQLQITKLKGERDAIQQTISQFEKLLEEFNSVAGGNLDPNVLRQWVNDYTMVIADGPILALNLNNRPNISCKDALAGLVHVDDLAKTIPRIISDCVSRMERYAFPPEIEKFCLTYDELLAISVYTYDLGAQFNQKDNFYFSLNKYLRERKLGPMAKFWRPYIYYFQSALSKIPFREVVAYRGVDSTGVISKDYSQGRKINWTGYTSCSTSRESAIQFSGEKGIIFEIRAKRGKDLNLFSWFPLEEEVLLSPNSTFLVVSPLHKCDGISFIALQEYDDLTTFVF